MFEQDKTVIRIKNNYEQARKMVNLFAIIVLALAFVYYLYWVLITNDTEHTFDDTKQYFLPLAMLFFPKEAGSNIIFQYTSFALLACGLPIVLIYYVLDIIKDYIIKSIYKYRDYEVKQLEKELKANDLLQYEVIKHISICLSLDWESDSNITESAKTKLNIGLYEKIKTALAKVKVQKNVSIKNTLVVTFDSFKEFDSLFYLFINVLAKIKLQMERNGNIEMVPTITVDAYSQPENVENIEANHFKIMKFNFKNKALSSSMFVKKYQFLHLKTYRGYSIGDYSTFDEKNETLELHVIYDNLNDELERINGRY